MKTADEIDMELRDWLKQSLLRTGYDNSGLAAAWGLERTAVSKVLSGVRRLLVLNLFQACEYLQMPPPGLTVVSRPADDEVDILYSKWFAENFNKKGDKAELAKHWGVDRATVSKAASGRRPLTAVEAILAARLFKSNPPGIELERMRLSGPRMAEPLAIGLARDAGTFEPTPYLIEADPEYPHADLRVHPVEGPGLDAMKGRPILKGDLVVAVQLKDIRGPKRNAIRDGSVVVVRVEHGTMHEFSLRRLEWTDDGLLLHPDTKKKGTETVRLDGISDSGSVRIVALARRVISPL